jgi:3-oxoadipate enol-lactonase
MQIISNNHQALATNNMEKFVQTNIGQIAVDVTEVNNAKTPIIFLHGVYFDRYLWEEVVENITDRTVVLVDMPMHGKSKNISNTKWTLQDCADMLIQLLDELKLSKVIAIGHSWGSMTICLAAAQNPSRFQSVLLCNMPHQKMSKKDIFLLKIQHLALVFKNFYIHQASKALFDSSSLIANPKLVNKLTESMNNLARKEIVHTDYAVRINSIELKPLIESLEIPFYMLVGKTDYVESIPGIDTVFAQGGHISPLEDLEHVSRFIQKILLSY